MSDIIITKQHAISLSNLVKWFKSLKLVASGGMVSVSGQSGPDYNFTLEYCEELLRGLELQEANNKEIEDVQRQG